MNFALVAARTRRLCPCPALFLLSRRARLSQGHGSSNDDENLLEVLIRHQRGAKRLPMATEVRTMLRESNGIGTLSTNSVHFSGFPSGSVVEFAIDNDGLPVFSFSQLAAHTKSLLVSPKASLVVCSNGFKSVADGRVALLGNVAATATEAENDRLKNLYALRHSSSTWIHFSDFQMFKMHSLVAIQYVGGFARAGTLSSEEYAQATVDPIAPFAAPAMKHMNEDHREDIVAMVRHYVGVPVLDPRIIAIDQVGMTVSAVLQFADYSEQTIRVPFTRAATDRKSLKDIIVEMSRAAAATSSARKT